MQNHRLHLTDLVIRSIPFSDGTKYIWDAGLRGFGVRIGKFSKTFVAVRDGGRRVTLGRYPAVALKDARDKARTTLYAAKPVRPDPNASSTEDIVTAYLKARESSTRPSTQAQMIRLLARLTVPFGDKPITAVTTRDLTSITDSLLAMPSAATHTHTAFSTFFNWALARRYVTQSPIAGVPPPAPLTERDRVLTDAELIAVYRTALQLGYPFGTIIRVCIHTMMRRNEVGFLKWSYLSDEVIALPKEITKNGREHSLPNLIAPILAKIPRSGDYVFPSARGTPFNNWSDSKRALDKLCGVTGWTIHDLRRTGRSKLAEWDCCSPEIAERVLGHVTAQSKIARIYNRWSHLPQMKVAMERYEHKLRELLETA